MKLLVLIIVNADSSFKGVQLFRLNMNPLIDFENTYRDILDLAGRLGIMSSILRDVRSPSLSSIPYRKPGCTVGSLYYRLWNIKP